MVARLVSVLVVTLVGVWVGKDLGGVALAPVPKEGGTNDTNQLFNWHPVLMTLAFAVFMSEALLAYASPLLSSWSRPARKRVHYLCHGAAGVCAAFGLVAVFQSHNLKLPTPMANLYSAHSYLGLMAVCLFAAQFGFGLVAYLYPQLSLQYRQALGPVHRFGGMAVWGLGLAAMATGFVEKTTFLQMGMKIGGDALYSEIMRIPAVVLLLLGVLAVVVLYHQVPTASAPQLLGGGMGSDGTSPGHGHDEGQNLLNHGSHA